MKGAIVHCLGDMVKENFGEYKWIDSLGKAGINTKTIFSPISNIDDSQVLKLIDSLCANLNISSGQAAEAFGEYWVNVYAPKVYQSYYMNVKSAREFLEKMDRVHESVTKNVPNARPPRFDYDWIDDKTLIMKYKSDRGLIDIFAGLVRGVGIYFKENLQIYKMGTDKLRIVFPK